MKVAEKEPSVEDVIVVGEVGWFTPSYFIVMVDDAANPVPVTVTVEPIMPVLGFRFMEAVTVKIADAV